MSFFLSALPAFLQCLCVCAKCATGGGAGALDCLQGSSNGSPKFLLVEFYSSKREGRIWIAVVDFDHLKALHSSVAGYN